MDATGGDAGVAGEELGERRLLVCSSDQPQDLAGPGERRVGEGHTYPSLVRLSEGYQSVLDVEDGVAGYQGGGMAVGAEPQVDQVEVFGQRRGVGS